MTAWEVIYSAELKKWLRKADPKVAYRIRSSLKALSGNFSGLWRYRVGKYRVVADIQDDRLVILALEVENRDYIYDYFFRLENENLGIVPRFP